MGRVARVDVECQRSLAWRAQAAQILTDRVAEAGHLNLVSRVAAGVERRCTLDFDNFELGRVTNFGHQGVDLGALSENRHGSLQLRAKENPHWAGYWGLLQLYR
ncbi:hypothetical protein D3C81_860480 [compost metagenome]